jgi:hypothetical protein
MVTSYKRFCSDNNTIDNCVPLQIDNRKPKEIVIHLYKEVDGFEENSSLNNSINIMKHINEEKSRNLTVFLKNEIHDKSMEILHKDKVCRNETNESSNAQAQNLSNNFLDNTESTSIISCYVSGMKPQTTDFNAEENQYENVLRELNPNESLYAISESTRIQVGDKDGTYDDID